ncbi:SMI1/KNR4 family protein [Kitasatospora sp. NPDC094019]|uniref:SMI1/KNR4 family protein n=1 Tax=Kitasatospora sp. NPDC094019 TaxID=3364091 RepID=UPI00381B7313
MITGHSLATRLRSLAARVPFDLAVLPGLDGTGPDATGLPLPAPVPPAERELLRHLGGFSVPPVEVRLIGHPGRRSNPALPDPRHVVSDDGGGGFTWVDLAPDGTWGQVLMQYREGGLYVQAPSLAAWLDRLVGTAEDLVDGVGFEDGVQPYADEFWDALHPDGPELPLHPAPTLRTGTTDPALAALARTVPDRAVLADLRDAAPGSRARFDRACGPHRLLRAADAPVFAAVPWDWQHDRPR